jgi:two-component system, NtrC family, response regulator GlrR
MPLIAIVDDDEDTRTLFAYMLRKEGYEVSAYGNGTDFLTQVEKAPDHYDLVLSDFMLGRENGLDLYLKARNLGLRSPYLLMTAYGDFSKAVLALKSGISDYLIKPIEPDILLQKVASYLDRNSMEQELLATRLGESVVARSGLMEQILRKLSRLADSKASVLLTGESGTGKEVLSRMLHKISKRGDGPFVAVNVSAIPETLFEAEFFGYRKGSFTDAVRDHEGYARMASGGTLFLDEVGELSASSQAKLLRLLEERKVQPLGSKEVITVDFRLLAATNRNLERMIRDDEFREDLYYRLAVVSIEIPPLRQRPEDIIPLARHLLNILSKEEGREVLDFTPQAQEKMLAYSWPGNVRELRNRVYESLLGAEEKWIDANDLNLPGEKKVGKKILSYQGAKSRFEKRYLVHLLRIFGGNINRIAEVSALSRKTIYEMMKKSEISPGTFRKHYFKSDE